MELVLLTIVVFLNILSDGIATHLTIEESIERSIVRQIHRCFHFSALDLDERLVCPSISIEYPTREYLFCSQSLIAPGSIYLLAEIEGKGLYRTDAVVVENMKLAKLLCSFLWQYCILEIACCRFCMQCLYIAHAEDECCYQRSLLEQRTLQ